MVIRNRSSQVTTMEAHGSHPLHALPVAQSGRLITFDTAQVVTTMIYPPRPVLVVSGHKPYPTMKVELVPLVYIRRPEYWGIEVVGSPRGAAIQAMPAVMTPYTVELDLAGVTGTVGIEVIGANGTEQIPLATEDASRFVGAVEGGRFRLMFPLWVPERFLRLSSVSVKDDVPPEAAEIDLVPYEGSILQVLGHHQDAWIYSAAVVEHVSDSILAIIARQVFPDRTE